jgi:hypothetical protein
MKNMMIYAAKWNDKQTFRLMPINDDCIFNEAIFDPEQKVLAVISKDIKEKPMMMPRLNDRGDIIPTKRANGEQGWQEQRVILDAYYEYYIEDMSDILLFVKMFAINDTCDVLVNIIAQAVNNVTEAVTEEPKKTTKKSK